MNKITIIFIVLFALVLSASAQIPDRPNPPRLVNDLAGVLNKNEYNNLENSLEQFARQTSTQIVVVTVPDLQGYDRADFTFQIGEKWGVGQEGKDNGLVVMVKPKTRESSGQVFIATGYGLEAVLPDAIVNREIVRHEMLPRFEKNDYYGGLVAGINVIMDITRGEYTAEQYQENVEAGSGAGIPFILFFFVLIFWIFGRSRRRRFYSPGRSLPFWLALGMMSGGSHRSSGSFGNFSSGGGSFGGFGGFGGGSFGGGGAGGSW